MNASSTTALVPIRHRLPRRRPVDTSSATIAGHTLHVGIGRYPDGRVGEIWIDLAHREGAPLRGFAQALAKTISIGLQHGVPPEAFAAQLRGDAFEPCGDVYGDRDVQSATSLVDYIAQVLEVAARGTLISPPSEAHTDTNAHELVARVGA